MWKATAHINLKRLGRNLQQLQQVYQPEPPSSNNNPPTFCVPNEAYAVVKANAYGHGWSAVCHYINQHFHQSIGFATSDTQHAIQLKQRFCKRSVLHLHGFLDATELSELSQNQVEMVLHSPEQIQILTHSKLTSRPTIWLKLNSGMNRLGFRCHDGSTVLNQWGRLAKLQQQGILIIKGVINHFSCADDANSPANAQQLQLLQRTLTQLHKVSPIRCLSLSNSAALINGFYNQYKSLLTTTQLHGEIARIGIALYGGKITLGKTDHYLPVMRLIAPIIAIQKISNGERVGYGLTWKANRNSIIAVVKIGYGDGYPRQVNKAKVAIAGQLFPVVGRVSMDLLCVDISVSKTPKSIQVGDVVELWGDQIRASQVAEWASNRYNQTLDYELFCQLTQRVIRQYHD